MQSRGDGTMANAQTQTQAQTQAPKSAPAAQQPEAPTVADLATAAAHESRRADGAFDPAGLKAADRTVAAAVRADDAEVGKVFLARGRKALRAEISAILDAE